MVRPCPPLAALLALSLAGTSPAQNTPDPVVAALDRAVARARADVQKTTDLWEDHSTWDKAWVAQSAHFEVKTVQSWAVASSIAHGLDRMLEYFQAALAIDFAPAQKIKVFLYPDAVQYNAVGQNHAEHSSFYGSFYANQAPEVHVAAAPHPYPTMLRMQITHSVAHMYLDLAFPGTQKETWVEEGLAAYFALHWDYAWGLEELERLEKGYTWVPMYRLLRDPITAYGTSTHERMIELGMLFYYLLRYREDTRTTLPDEEQQRAPFRDYVLALLRGENARRFPVHDLLMESETLEQDFRAYEFPR
jgi:hypothetical protein